MRTIEKLNPIAVTVYFLLVSGVAMFCMEPVILLLSLLGAVALYLAQNGAKGGKTHASMLTLFLLMALINPLVSHRGATVLFVMNDNPITLEALIYGMAAAGMIVAVMYWFGLFSQIMTSDKLLYVLDGLSPKLALLLSMTLRYVPLFGRQARKVSQSQKALGLYKEDNIIDAFRSGMRVFSVMVTWTLENGIITADSMSARGYDLGKRSRFSLFRWHREDIVFILSTVLLFACTVCGISGREFVFYPVVIAPPLTTRAAIGYISYAALALLPTIIKGKEKLKWRLLISRM